MRQLAAQLPEHAGRAALTPRKSATSYNALEDAPPALNRLDHPSHATSGSHDRSCLPPSKKMILVDQAWVNRDAEEALAHQVRTSTSVLQQLIPATGAPFKTNPDAGASPKT